MAKKKKFVKDYEGNKVNIEDYKKGLDEWPAYARKVMDSDGNTSLTNATYRVHKCGCRIVGCGTLQFPLSIEFCEKHKSVK